MKTAKLLIALGLVLLALSLALALVNLHRDASAGAAAEAVLTQLRPAVPTAEAQRTAPPEPVMPTPEPLYQRAPEMEMPTQTVDGIEYVGILEIPGIDLQLPVISEWSYAGLKLAPCRYAGSAYQGSLVLAGHKYESHFGCLGGVKEDDLVRFTDMDGNEFRYRVAGLEILDREDTSGMLDSSWDLTLFTCTLGGAAGSPCDACGRRGKPPCRQLPEPSPGRSHLRQACSGSCIPLLRRECRKTVYRRRIPPYPPGRPLKPCGFRGFLYPLPTTGRPMRFDGGAGAHERVFNSAWQAGTRIAYPCRSKLLMVEYMLKQITVESENTRNKADSDPLGNSRRLEHRFSAKKGDRTMAIVFEDHSEWVKRGKLVTCQIAMDPMPDKRMRTIRVWTPESYDGVRRFPVLYLHDGQVVFPEKANPGMGSWGCDQHISELEPECQCMVVAIDTSDDRSNELLPPLKPNLNFGGPRRSDAPKPNPLGGFYADFVKNTLKPIIDGSFMTLPDAAHTAVGGASMGGLESLYMTFRDPTCSGAPWTCPAALASWKRRITWRGSTPTIRRSWKMRVSICTPGIRASRSLSLII